MVADNPFRAAHMAAPSFIPKAVGGAIIGTVALGTILGSYFTVAEYERSVVTRFGAVIRVAGPGLQWKIPFADSVTDFRTDIQAFVMDKVNTYTVDNQEIDATFTVNYRIPAESVERIYKDVPDYKARLASLAVDRFKSELGKINTIEVAQRRGEVAGRIRNLLNGEATRLLGLQVIDFQISNIDFTKTFRAAMDQAAAAKALVEKEEQDKRRAEVEAERAKITAIGIANKAREEARGAADATLLRAEADAKAIELRGAAEAANIKLRADALKANPGLVTLTQMERWDGKLPVNVYGSAPVPFLNVGNPK